MTTPTIPSITDEQLADLEQQCDRFAGFAVNSTLVEQLITRLRAAERDAERYLWLKENVKTEFYADQLVDMFTCSSQKIDRLVDAAMAAMQEQKQ